MGSDSIDFVALLDERDINTIKVPTGNEDGASKLWVPGIKPSGGVSEGLLTIPETAITRVTELKF